jgi:two-component system, OmpR family, sensor kinase
MDTDSSYSRLLDSLEQLMEISTTDLESALVHACDVIARALRADKVDAFLHDTEKNTLVALGTSRQPLSELQKKMGLDILQIANGGRVVDVFATGKTFLTGHLQADPEELRGVKEALKIQSKLGVPLEIGGERRGVIMIASLERDQWTADDARFAESVVRWVGIVAHRIALVEEVARESLQRGGRAVAEELVTVLAHDLRNHLAPISYRLQQLHARAESGKREVDVRDLAQALRGITRLDRMMTEILDVARLDVGLFHLDLAPVDVVAVTRDVATMLSTAEKPVQVHATQPLIASVDEPRFRQCLENVIANAQQFSPRSIAVSVNVYGVTRRTGEWVRVEVHDEGPGISAEMLPRLFDRFATGGKGLGLGLYLASRIAAAHGGELKAESPPGKGAHFTLLLPLGR